MECSVLLPLPNDPPGRPLTHRQLRVGRVEGEIGRGVLVRRGLVAERLLTSVRERTVTLDLITTIAGAPRLEPDNPFLAERQRRRLDGRGLIRMGTVLEPADVLASVVAPVREDPDRTAPTEGTQWALDRSEPVPPGWAGAVVVRVVRRSRRELGESAPRGLNDRVEIALRAEHDLDVGDLLLADDAPLGLVARVVPDAEMPRAGDGEPADLLLPGPAARRLGLAAGETARAEVAKAAALAVDAVGARSMGPYALISRQPLGKATEGGGQPIRANHVRWLRSRGLEANLAELLALKCDDLAGRPRLRMASPGQGDVPEPGMPESLRMLVAWLSALGLDVRPESAGNAVALTIRPATTAEIVARSGGPVLKPETLNYRTFRDEPGGLFCPMVFGPSDRPRRRRPGHVILPCPVVPYLWRAGSPSALERLLGLPARQIERVVLHRAHVRRSGDEVRVVDPPDGGPVPPAEDGAEDLGTGAAAIRELLRALPSDRLPRGLAGRVEALTPTAVPVVPPDLRPLVLLDSGNFATHDVNDLYRRLVNRANRLAKLEQLNAPAPILANERRMLQQAADGVWANGLLPRSAAVQRGAKGARLFDAFTMVARALLGAEPKRVDFSGRARVVADDALWPDHVEVPRWIYDTLGLDEAEPVLVTRADGGGGRFLAMCPHPLDEPVLRVVPEVFTRLGLDGVEVPACVIHRPLGAAARAEAERLSRGDPGPIAPDDEGTGWIDGADEASILSGLVEAALRAEPVRLASPRGLLIGGTGVIGTAEEPGLEDDRRESGLREIPLRPPSIP